MLFVGNNQRKLYYIWSMEKSLKIVQLKDKSTDFIYWMSKTDIERLQAVETLRQQYINYKKDVQSRLQRVYRVINRKQGWIFNCWWLSSRHSRTPKIYRRLRYMAKPYSTKCRTNIKICKWIWVFFFQTYSRRFHKTRKCNSTGLPPSKDWSINRNWWSYIWSVF